MRNYPLHDLNEDEFENLTTLICRKILGEAVIPFAKGTDGGRDGRFHGKANCFPSETQPWEGQIVIQAKHTTKVNASCSDSEFQKILRNEVLPAIDRLKSVGKITHYMLFTNRKLTGKQDEKIEDLIDCSTGIPNIVIALEKIQQWLKSYSDVVREAKLRDLLNPLQFDESDLKDIITLIHKALPDEKELENAIHDLTFIDKNKKNELNKLSQEYFDDVIKKHYIYFDFIKTFLSDPINSKIKDLYEDTIDELNAKIAIFRNEYAAFENILEELYDHVISSNYDLKFKKRLVRVFLNYMYCSCDIGKKEL
jgi:hypothetical protein